MGKLVVQEFLSVDGVMQAPGQKNEDTRNDFEYGGWQLPYYDEVVVGAMIERYKAADALLLGARTYSTFAEYWPTAPDDGNPFVSEMNRLKKYVVSKGDVELTWDNSERLQGDVVSEVKKLKESANLLVLGSGELVQTLVKSDLVDEYLLMVAPIKLGNGLKLFREDHINQKLKLTKSAVASTGELILTYEVLRSE